MRKLNCYSMMHKCILFVLLFCYVFAFYIGPFSVSILISIPLYFYAYLNKGFAKEIKFVISTPLLRNALKLWFVLVIFAFLFPAIYLTLDLSFLRVVGMQGVHFIAAIPFFAYLRYTGVSHDDIEHYYVYIFLLQTIIQLIVVNNSYLGEKILFFNHYVPEKVVGVGSGIRGKALSAATTYHLTMAYGFCFIIYLKTFISNKNSYINIFIGILIFIGIFFAGRSGFVACLIGALGYIFYRQVPLSYRIKTILKTIFFVLVFIILSSIILISAFPDFWSLLNEQILPYAFEFLYSIDTSGSVETASTNHLRSMWLDSDFNFFELFFGSGRYTNPDGSYYMHVDPGILRHLLFMGVFGYAILIIYQLYLFPVWRMKGDSRYYYSLILLFLFIMEFKGINIGLNKFAFAITLLLSFSYFYLPPNGNYSSTQKNSIF